MNGLIQLDKYIFHFINSSLANPITDFIMPIVTSFHYWFPFYILGMIYLLYRYRLKGIYILIILIFSVGLCDFINAQFLKEFFMRVRPCRSLENVHLLIHCGQGLSFPSNHAVNNFSAAAILSYYFKRKANVFFFFAALVSISRVFVGVHFFGDIFAGAIEGFFIASIILFFISKLDFDKKVLEKIRVN